MERCETCVHWRQNSDSTGDCGRVGTYFQECKGPGMITTNHVFGCIAHEPKPPEPAPDWFGKVMREIRIYANDPLTECSGEDIVSFVEEMRDYAERWRRVKEVAELKIPGV